VVDFLGGGSASVALWLLLTVLIAVVGGLVISSS
jgi:hypothetical protein